MKESGVLGGGYMLGEDPGFLIPSPPCLVFHGVLK